MKNDIITNNLNELVPNSMLNEVIMDFDKISNNLQQYVLKLINSANIGNILHNIENNVDYVLDIPLEYRKKIQSGEYFIMKNKESGKMWANLMTEVNGKKEIVTPLNVIEKRVNPLGTLTPQINMMALQYELKEQRKLIEDVIEVVKDIKEEQECERLGLLNSGMNEFILATTGSMEQWDKNQMDLGRHNMITAQGEIYEILKKEMEKFKAIPNEQYKIVFNEIFKRNYVETIDSQFQKIQNLYELYLLATNMIGVSYMLIGDINRMTNSYKIAKANVLKLPTVNFETIKNLDANIGELLTETINKDFDYYEQECKNITCRNMELKINISNQKMRELIQNGR